MLNVGLNLWNNGPILKILVHCTSIIFKYLNSNNTSNIGK